MDLKPIVLHFYDDEKIVDSTFLQYKNSFPQVENVGIVFTNSPLRYVKNISDYQILHSNQIVSFFKSYDYQNVTCVFIHFLTSGKIKALRYIPSHVKIGWGVYGGDLYNRYLRYFGYPLLYDSRNSYKCRISNFVKKIIRKVEFRYLVSRLNFITGVRSDYDLFLKYAYNNPNIIYANDFCYALDTQLGALYGCSFNTGNVIQVGNSASITNNHLYILDFLHKLNLKDQKILLQLSYGDSQGIVNKVKYEYTTKLACKVEICETFVPLNVYQKNLQSLHTFISGSWRQEALGNILIALYMGVKVYLSNKNPLLQYFRNEGVIVFELESIKYSFNYEMMESEKEHNRQYVKKNHNSSRNSRVLEQALAQFFLKK